MNKIALMVEQRENTSNQRAKLTSFIRLIVYSYLSQPQTLQVSCLSRRERQWVFKSCIIREGRHAKVILTNRNLDGCIMDNRRFERVYSKFEKILALNETLELVIDENLGLCQQHPVGEEVAKFICNLGKRFDDRKVSLVIRKQRYSARFIEHFVGMMMLKHS